MMTPATYFKFLRVIPSYSKCILFCGRSSLIPYHGASSLILCSKILRTFCSKKELVTHGYFSSETKDKETYLCALDLFKGKDIHRRGHVEFIYAALRYMDEFGVSKDVEVYKALLDVLPKGKFIPQNIFQVEFMHYPKQQQCAIDLLEKMEDNGVIPDREMEIILVNIFGRRGYPLRKYGRMMYWMPKFKNLSPWPLPNPLPNDTFELAMLAIKRISSVDVQSSIKVYQTEHLPDSLDKTWIICAQSSKQQELLAQLGEKSPVYVEGAFRIWLRNSQVHYFVLRSDALVKPAVKIDDDDVSNLKIPLSEKKKIAVPQSVHEQDDGTILAVFATGTSSRDSLLSLIRHLEQDGNPHLSKIPVLFTLKSPLGEIIPLQKNA